MSELTERIKELELALEKIFYAIDNCYHDSPEFSKLYCEAEILTNKQGE